MIQNRPTLPSLDVSVDGAIARVRLNRPERANALDNELWYGLRRCFEWLNEAEEVRVVILSAYGSNFCAGIDFSLLGEIRDRVAREDGAHGRESLRRLVVDLQECLNAVERCRKPVIAAIHGACLGAGLDLAACCDMRYAKEDARFAVREIDLGIVADMGVLQRLPLIVGEGRAREMAFTGRDVAAHQARDIGLVNEVFSTQEDLLAAAAAVAEAIAAKSPLAVRGVKEVLNYSRDHSVADGLQYVAAYNAATLLSADLEEALAARREARPPVFRE